MSVLKVRQIGRAQFILLCVLSSFTGGVIFTPLVRAQVSNTCHLPEDNSGDPDLPNPSSEDSAGADIPPPNLVVPPVALPPTPPPPPEPRPAIGAPRPPAEWTARVEESIRVLIREARSFEVNGTPQGMLIRARLGRSQVNIPLSPRHRASSGDPYGLQLAHDVSMRVSMAENTFNIDAIHGISLLVKIPFILPDEVRINSIVVDFVRETAVVQGAAIWGAVHFTVRADLRRRELRGIDWHFGGASPVQALASTLLLLSSTHISF